MIHSKGKLLLRSAALIALVVVSLGILSVLVVHADETGPGTIIIKKQTEPPGGAGFEFTDDIPGGPALFYLNHGEQQQFTDVPQGTYTVTETDPAVTPGDYTLTDVECVEEKPDKSWASPSLLKATTRTVTVELPPGGQVTCTFTNRRMPVGGFIVPVNKLGLLMPWLGLAALASLAIVMVALLRRRRA
jgi:hypothetical protein